MTDRYSKNLIRDYTYWSVYLAENQGYLGRCVIWCKRKNAFDLTDATENEILELFSVICQMKKVLTKAFNPDWFNHAFLGNETRHLHGHFIPRYSKSQKFFGKIFEDKLYGHNYKTDKDFKISRSLFVKIKIKIKNTFKKLQNKSEDKLFKIIKKAEKETSVEGDLRTLMKKIK